MYSGQRWIYDGTRDPVSVAQVVALLGGRVRPQAQSASDTSDPSVVVSVGEFAGVAAEFVSAVDGQSYTDIAVGSGTTVRIERVVRPAPAPVAGAPVAAHGHVSAPWQRTDGSTVRGVLLAIRA